MGEINQISLNSIVGNMIENTRIEKVSEDMKSTMHYTVRFLAAAALLVVAGLFVPSEAHAQPYYYRWGPTAPGVTCSSSGGDITINFDSQPVEWNLPAVSEFSYIYDYNGTTSPSGPFPTGQTGVGSTVFAGLTSGAMTATYPAYFAVTLNTYIGGELVYTSTLRGDCVADGAGTASITNQEITPGNGAPAAQEPVPGPDLVNLPSGSVVGAFVTSTPAYFAPQAGAATSTVLDAGKTLWVLGVDASGQFYKVVLAGKYFWVPVRSMGPNYDEVWQGTPLPTTVVD